MRNDRKGSPVALRQTGMGKACSVFRGLTVTKSLKGLEHVFGKNLKQLFIPRGFTGQQPNGYNASIKVSCLLLLYLLMVSTQSILRPNRRKNSGGNKPI